MLFRRGFIGSGCCHRAKPLKTRIPRIGTNAAGEYLTADFTDFTDKDYAHEKAHKGTKSGRDFLSSRLRENASARQADAHGPPTSERRGRSTRSLRGSRGNLSGTHEIRNGEMIGRERSQRTQRKLNGKWSSLRSLRSFVVKMLAGRGEGKQNMPLSRTDPFQLFRFSCSHLQRPNAAYVLNSRKVLTEECLLRLRFGIRL